MRVVIVAEQPRRRVPGGIGTYLRGLLGGLKELGSESLEGPEVELSSSRLPPWAVVRVWDAGLGGPRAADCVHAPSFAIPPSGNAPLSVMVHDLGWRHLPQAYPARGRRWHEKALQRALARAAILMVPSADTADDLLAAGAPASRVEVVPEGADHLPPADDEGAAELLRLLSVEGDYLLTVSTLEPRKNLARLLAAFESARTQLGHSWRLVVVGPTGWGDAGVARTAPGSGVVLAGHVSDTVLSGLYARARLMAYVPLKEGFGLPVLEAMRAGAPVIASPVPSAGDATLQVDPTDVDSIATAIVAGAMDDGVRDHLIGAGRERAAAFTWRRAAERHVELWRDMYDGRARPNP
ncbi:MAG TPA: glycosyltransferase family 1 protein [Acidimicrobiales bacterium]|nr:glycosyltransferase family 1 protein [Acidimicrobiales bacterium]